MPTSSRTNTHRTPRTGLTLVELLVVVTILVMLVSVTVPLMRSLRNGSDVTAAMQKVESLINAAKTEAIVTGRPASVVFVREENTPNVGYRVAMAKSPPPYLGDGANALAGVALGNPSTEYNVPNSITQRYETIIYFDASLVRPPGEFGNPLANPNVDSWFVRPKDTIKLNYRGAEHDIIVPMVAKADPPTGIPPFHIIAVSTKEPLPLAIGSLVPFQVFRAPRVSVSSTIELPNGVALRMPHPLNEPLNQQFGFSRDRNGEFLNNAPDSKFFGAGNVGFTFSPTGEMMGVLRGLPLDTEVQEFASNSSLSQLEAWKLLVNTSYIRRPMQSVRFELSSGNLDNPSSRERFVIDQKSQKKIKMQKES